MADEPIPLYDGELSGAKIRIESNGVHDPHDSVAPRNDESMTSVARSRRRTARHGCERIHVCFTPLGPDGKSDNVECPVIDMSKGGLAIEFDQSIASGTPCRIAYRTISQNPVQISGTVRNCRDIGDGRYRLGIRLARNLTAEELRPARRRDGRDIAPGIRARPLR